MLVKEQVLGLGMTLVEVHPDDAKAHAIYGDLLYQLDRNEEALAQYKRTLALDDTVFPVWENAMQLHLLQKNYDSLIDLSEEAMDLFPNQGTAYYYNGLAYKEKGTFNEAMASLELVLLMASNNLPLLQQTYQAIGEVYQQLEKFDLAEDAFNRANYTWSATRNSQPATRKL